MRLNPWVAGLTCLLSRPVPAILVGNSKQSISTKTARFARARRLPCIIFSYHVHWLHALGNLSVQIDRWCVIRLDASYMFHLPSNMLNTEFVAGLRKCVARL